MAGTSPTDRSPTNRSPQNVTDPPAGVDELGDRTEADVEAEVAAILDRLVAAGGRRTAPRRAIVEALVRAGGHVTADDLAETVHQQVPSVNLSTVYRTLEALADLDVVDHVHLGHGSAVYHLTERGHQHLYCEACGRVQSLPIDKLEALARLLDDEYGFRLDERHFALVGTCRRCRREA